MLINSVLKIIEIESALTEKMHGDNGINPLISCQVSNITEMWYLVSIFIYESFWVIFHIQFIIRGTIVQDEEQISECKVDYHDQKNEWYDVLDGLSN